MVHELLSQQLVPQLPSQVSPSSTKLLEQTGMQSLSLRLLHPGAQHPSLLAQLVTAILVQKASQAVAEPFNVSTVQTLESSHVIGQFPSQLSFVSITLFPQLGVQSPSLLLLHPLGQHWSPCAQVVMSENTQTASQVCPLPLRASDVQTNPSSQVVGQLPSQISPASTTLFEQSGAQSSSLRLLHPGAQQPSPEIHVTIAGYEQAAVQAVEEPDNVLVVHAFWSSQLEGQSPSQVSPVSNRLLPQMGWQSLSEMESQPPGQQSSLWRQVKIGLLAH